MIRLFNVKSALVALVVLGLSLGANTASASTPLTTTFGVSATVQGTCVISANSLGFGTYTGLATTSTSSILVTCTNTTSYNVGLDAGTSTGASVTSRKMTGPSSATLAYSLFTDSAYSNNWGTTIGTNTYASAGTGSQQTITVYGSVAAGQYVTPGSYTDTITATITY